jgi:hypothetical protein
MGIGLYETTKEAFGGLRLEETTEPDTKRKNEFQTAYSAWLVALEQKLQRS